jgi:hypothetical protein
MSIYLLVTQDFGKNPDLFSGLEMVYAAISCQSALAPKNPLVSTTVFSVPPSH